jgi:hypothetical protein
MFLDFSLESIDMKRGLPFCRCHLLLCRHCKGGDGMAGAGRSRDMLETCLNHWVDEHYEHPELVWTIVNMI